MELAKKRKRKNVYNDVVVLPVEKSLILCLPSLGGSVIALPVVAALIRKYKPEVYLRFTTYSKRGIFNTIEAYGLTWIRVDSPMRDEKSSLQVQFEFSQASLTEKYCQKKP
jgi:hypothetical protein